MIVLIITLVGIVLIICTAIISKQMNERRAKYREAAQYILKNEYLDYSISNKSLHSNAEEPMIGNRTMIYLESSDTKPKSEFIFDPHHEIVIGRGRGCNICLSEITVSTAHCRIAESGGNVYIQDMGSSNGTFIKRGLFHSYVLKNNQMQLRNKDVIKVGSTSLKLTIFVYNSAMM